MADDKQRCSADGHPPGDRFDAASLLLRAPDAHGRPLVLMARGGSQTTHPAGWGLPGGARRNHESPVATALRTTAERTGVDPRRVRVRGERIGHPDGSYSTIVADTAEPLPVQPAPAAAQRAEQLAELAWIPELDVSSLDLQPAFAASWPALQAPDTVLVVDAANVVGSRPDGWWRDRAGAAERLLRALAAAGPGVFALPDGAFRWVANPVVVLEGKAKQAPDVAGVEVVRAAGSGDDTIVELAHGAGDHLVVTADRGLRARLPSSARAVGPTLLRSWLIPAPPPEETPDQPDQPDQ